MDINSLVDKILHDITTGMPCKVNVVERSFYAELLDIEENEEVKENEPLLYDCEYPKLKDYYENNRFPLVSYIINLGWWFLRMNLLILYSLAGGVYKLMTGHKRKKGLEYSVRFNAVIFFSTLITFIVILIASVLFFIRSVLFLPPDNNVNGEGTMSMKQPCGQEQYLYVYNTAQSWANTGIELLKGDKVEITSSGYYYSSIADMCERAETNKPPRYLPTDTLSKREKELVEALSVYRVPRSDNSIDEPHFGYLLFSIRSDEDWDYDDPNSQKMIYQAERKSNSTFTRTIEVENNGRLFVSINDIYLSKHVLDTLLMNRKLFDMVIHTKDTLDSKTIGEWVRQIQKPQIMRNVRDSVLFSDIDETYFSKINVDRIIKDKVREDTLQVCKNTLEKRLYKRDSLYLTIMADKRKEAWFDDNVGEILVNVTVTRNIYGEGNFLSSFISRLYRSIKWQHLAMIAIGILVFLLFDRLGKYIYVRRVEKKKKKAE